MQSSILRWIGSSRAFAIQFDITNSCNLNCSHCYHSHHKNDGALSLDEWTAVFTSVNELVDELGLDPEFILCGGEPLRSNLLYPILDLIKKMRPQAQIFILSNGTLLNERNVEKLSAYNPIFQISLDGPDENDHDTIRGQGSFTRAKRGIELLLKRNIQVDILAVLSTRSAEWIEDFFVLAKSLKVQNMNFQRLIASGHAKENMNNGENLPLGPLQLKDALTAIVENSEKYQVPTNTNKPLFCLIRPDLGAHSRLGFDSIIIGYEGSIKLTSRIGIKLGNVRIDNLRSVFLHHPLLKKLRKSEIDGCGSCIFFHRCGGCRNSSYAQLGDVLGKDPGCWL